MSAYCFGVDVGGTTVKMGLFGAEQKLLHKWEIPTRTEENGAHILEDIRDAMAEEMKARNIRPEEILGVGIGLPGPVTPEGVVNRCVNLGWPVVEVEKDLSALFYDIPVKAGNDANVAALGEAWFGAGQGHNSMVMVTLGTGVGGGIIINGQILPGSHGAAGEMGHIAAYDEARVPCNCGRTGCLEQIGSATGIVNKARELLAETDWPSALRGRDNLTAKDVLDLHATGDKVADATIEALLAALGRGMAAVACVVDPEVFVIGGGVSKAGQWLMEALEESFRSQAFHACRESRVIAATLGNDAGIYGAAAMVLSKS